MRRSERYKALITRIIYSFLVMPAACKHCRTWIERSDSTTHFTMDPLTMLSDSVDITEWEDVKAFAMLVAVFGVLCFVIDVVYRWAQSKISNASTGPTPPDPEKSTSLNAFVHQKLRPTDREPGSASDALRYVFRS